jgi:hypothetical protein
MRFPKTSLRTLAEELIDLVGKEGTNLELVDYWRTIQGAKVGFHGPEGRGIPIVGPPVLTGSGSTPLLRPLMEAYPKGTFIGDAIRKKNFPISNVMFIEKIVGSTDEAIKKEFQRVENALDNIYDQHLKKKATSPVYAKYSQGWSGYDKDSKTAIIDADITDTWNGDASLFEVRGNEFGMPTMPFGMTHFYSFLNHNDKSVSFAREVVASMLTAHYDDPSEDSSLIYGWLGRSGVLGYSHSGDASNDKDAYERYTEILSEGTNWFKPDSTSKVKKLSVEEFDEQFKAVIREVYLLNQIALRGKKTLKLVRGFGNTLPKLDKKDSKKIYEKLQDEAKDGTEIAIRVAQRQVSGYSVVAQNAKEVTSIYGNEDLSKDNSGHYDAWADVPSEAILSSINGFAMQNFDIAHPDLMVLGMGAPEVKVKKQAEIVKAATDLFKASFPNTEKDNAEFAMFDRKIPLKKPTHLFEKEALVLGASEIQFGSKNVRLVRNTK